MILVFKGTKNNKLFLGKSTEILFTPQTSPKPWLWKKKNTDHWDWELSQTSVLLWRDSRPREEVLRQAMNLDRKWQGHTGSTGKWQSDMKRERWLPSDSLRGNLKQLMELGWVLKHQIRSRIDVNTSYCKEGGPFRGPVPVWDQQNRNEGGRNAYHRLVKDHTPS